jgi:hypothetical protein
VIVEARDHRHTRPDDTAYALQQRAVRIRTVLRNHRTMQIEVDTVEPATALALESSSSHR